MLLSPSRLFIYFLIFLQRTILLSLFYLFLPGCSLIPTTFLSFLTPADPARRRSQARIIESKPRQNEIPEFLTFPMVPLSHLKFEALVSSLLRMRQKKNYQYPFKTLAIRHIPTIMPTNCVIIPR